MKYLIICLAFSLFSCSGNSQEQSNPASDDKKSSNKTSCLADITDPAQWYSLSSVAALVNMAEESIEQKVYEKMNSLQYNWRTDRSHIMKLGKAEMEVPTNNVIAIVVKNLDEAIERATRMHRGRKTFTYEEYFNSYHSQVTKEDQKIIDEQIDKKGEEDENFDSKTAKKLLAMAPTENYSDISDLGDRANKYVQLAPGLRETRLAVLFGNVVILISVDVSDEDSDDLDAAKTVAKAVMGLCD